MKDVPVLINSGGGAASADPDIAKTVEAALREAGVAARVELLTGDDCTVRLSALAEREDPLVVVGGGDGTISAAASALAGTRRGSASCSSGRSITSRATFRSRRSLRLRRS